MTNLAALRPTRRLALMIGLAISLAACGGNSGGQHAGTQGGRDWYAPRGSGVIPDQVVVYDFAVTAQDVQLDSGAVATLQRNRPRLFSLLDQPPPAEQEVGIARSIADAFAADLTDELRAKGLPAVRAAGARPPSTYTMNVTGQFASIDEGSKSERIMIGFGAGASKVAMLVEVSQNRAMLAEFDVTETSGHKPGGLVALAKGPAALVASGGARAVIEQIDPALSREVKSAAKKVADQIAQTGRNQGWMK